MKITSRDSPLTAEKVLFVDGHEFYRVSERELVGLSTKQLADKVKEALDRYQAASGHSTLQKAGWKPMPDKATPNAQTDIDSALIAATVEDVGQYVAMKRQIEALTEEAEVVRARIIDMLYPEGPEPGKTFRYPGLAEISGVKGRKGATSLDRKVLAARGVSAADLDAATVRAADGKPSVRIEIEEGDAE